MPDDLSGDLERLLADIDIWRAKALITAAELDLFSVVEAGATTAQQVAEHIGTALEPTLRLLRALHEMGYVQLTSEGYKNSKSSAFFLVRSSPYYLGSWLELQASDWSSWGHLTEIVRTGAPPAGGSLFEDPARLRVLLNAAHERARIFHLKPLLDMLDLSAARSLIDVGGGAGSYSLAFCEAYPQLRCTVFDLPAAIEIARQVTVVFGQNRLSLCAGDFRHDELGGPFDVAFISNVLHGEPADATLALLRKVRRALWPGGQIIIRDSFLNEDGINNSGGALLGLALMIETLEGRTHRLCDVIQMLETVGFEQIQQEGNLVLSARVPSI